MTWAYNMHMQQNFQKINPKFLNIFLSRFGRNYHYLRKYPTKTLG